MTAGRYSARSPQTVFPTHRTRNKRSNFVLDGLLKTEWPIKISKMKVEPGMYMKTKYHVDKLIESFRIFWLNRPGFARIGATN
jgi:hypothetical protein